MAVHLRARIALMMVRLMTGLLGRLVRMIVMRGQHGGDGFDTCHPQHHGLADLAQGLRLRPLAGRDLQHKADMAILDHQALDHVLLNHGAAADRIDHLVQRLEYVIA